MTARVAAITVVWLAMFAVTFAIAPYIQRSAFVFFWLAVLFAAWYGGLVAALLAAVAAVLAVDWLIVPPIHAFNLTDPNEFLTLGIFAAVSLLVSTAASSLARAQHQASELAEQLQEQAIELEQQAEEAEMLSTEAEEARSTAEDSTARAQRLLSVAEGLNRASSPEEMAEVVFREAMAAVGADAGSLALLRDLPDGTREFETVHVRGFPQAVTDRFHRYPLRAGRPLSDAVLAGAPRLIESADVWMREYPAVVASASELEFHGFAAVPVTTGGLALGALAFSFREPTSFDVPRRTFLATLGEQCGLALERARAFEAERRAREFSASTLASIRDGFFALDADFRFRYVNRAAETMLHRSAAELLGLTPWEAFPQVHASALGEAYERVMRTRVAEVFEGMSVTIGSWIEARIYPSPEGLTVFIQDVTRRRRTQEASAFLVDASRLLSATLDANAILRDIATAAVPALGDWCAIDVLREPASRTWPPVLDRVAAVHEDPEKVRLGAAVYERYQFTWRDDDPFTRLLHDGTPMFYSDISDEMLRGGAVNEEHAALLLALHFRSSIVVPIEARGQVLGMLTLCMSESERRYDENDLALAQEVAHRIATAIDNARLFASAESARVAAETANQAKSQFLATMSHELRTPLNAIAGHIQLLELGLYGAVSEPQRDALDRVARAQRHLLGIINDILNYARLESGRVEYDVQPTDLREVLGEVLPMVEPQLTAKGVALDVKLPDDAEAIRVWADREKLGQIFLNLLSNAVKFTPSGGRVTVEHAARADASEPPGLAFVRVVDTGVGIPRDKLEAVFEPFVQLGKSYARESGGTGLGLSISRDLARGMGGDLRARSVEGEGSTFSVALRRV